jgi:hypothetical protein
MEDVLMKLHSLNPSGNRLSPIVLALVAALALPPAFAQTAPTAAAPTDPPTTNAPMHEATPATAPTNTSATDPANTPAVADSNAKPATFKELDANKDGKLSHDEVAGSAMWTSDFDTADTDKDGYISKSEFKKHEADIRKTAKNESKQH